PAIQSVSGLQLSAVGYRQSSKAKAREFAKTFACKCVSVEKLIKQVDAVYIPYPPALHYEWVSLALNAGCHVICEKSLATSEKEAIELIELAKKNNCVLMENYMFRFHCQHHFIKKLLSEIGEIKIFRASFAFPPFPNKDNIRYQKKLGGGALLDCAGYTIQAAMMYLGYDLSVMSATLSECEHSVDTFGTATLISKDGIVGQIYFGFENFYQCQYEIHGTKGILIAEKAFTPTPEHRPKVILKTSAGEQEYFAPNDNHFVKILEYFKNCIQEGNCREEFQNIQGCAKIQNDIRTLARILKK
ncbi:Gfo/Idh/MocA family oxidoreductase, partial [Arthrospira platensis SPKY2]